MSRRGISYTIILVVELSLFLYLYLRGTRGLFAYQALRDECVKLQNECDMLRKKIQAVSQEIEDWQQEPFYREQYARAQLQMAKPHEKWYRY